MESFFLCNSYRIRTHNLTLDEKFKKLLDTNFKGAYLTTEASVAYYNMKHITNNKIVVRPTLDRVLLMVNKGTFKGILISQKWFQPMCIYFRKHSCLTDAFDEQINIYTDSGLMDNWVSQFSQKKYVRFTSTENQRSHQKLQLLQLEGTFRLCLCMTCITIFIFFLELLSKKILIIRKLIEIFY